MAFSQLRPLSLGEMLDGAFTLYRRQFVSLFLTALLPQLPLIVMVALYYGFLAIGSSTEPDFSGAAGIAVLVAMLLLLPLVLIGSVTALGGVTFQMARAYTGTPVTTREALRRGLSRAVPLAGAYFVVFFLSMLGVFAFCIGFFVVWLAAFGVAPAVILERRGPIEAMSRSYALAKGAWLEVFLATFIASLIAVFPGWAVQGLALAALILTAGDQDMMMAVQGASTILAQLARTLTIPFSLGVTVLLYYDRRVRTEALDVQMMAESLSAAPTPAPPAPGWG
jgi:hypothetical protein